MSSLRLVPLLCCVLLPLPGLAQPQSQGDAPVEPSTPPPPLVPAPGAPQEETPPESPSQGQPRGELIPPRDGAMRGTGRVPVGLLLGAVGGAIGVIPGALITSAACDESCFQGTLIFGLTVAGVGLAGGSALAIHLVGDWMDGQGGFWPTALGTALGTVVGALASLAIAERAGTASIIPLVLGPAVGGVIAYELSHSSAAAEATAAATASRPRLVPLAAMTARGGFIGGLAGTF